MKLAGPTLALGLARVSSIVASFVLVPIALGYLGDARYGLWMALASFIMLLSSVADGGIGNGIISQTAKTDDLEQRRKILATGVMIVLAVCVAILLTFVPLAYFIAWDSLLTLKDGLTARDATTVYSIVIVAFAISMPVNITLKYRMGLKRFIGVGLWDMAAFLSVIPAVLIVRYYDFGFFSFVIAALITPQIIKGLGGVVYLLREHLNPLNLARFDWGLGKTLLRSGLVFVFITASQAIAINLDQFLIAMFRSVNEVTPYAILNKLFTVPYMGINLLLVVLWPMFARRWAQGDSAWLRSTFKKTLIGATLIAILGAVILYVFNAYILSVWIGRDFDDYPLLLLGMALYAPALVMVGVTSTLCVSLEFHKPQIFMNLAMMLVNLPLTIYLIQAIGAAGAIWATFISYVVCIIVPSLLFIPRRLRAGATT